MEAKRIFRIDRSLQESTHAQVLKQLKQHLHLGTVRSGDRLPSVRRLASLLKINPKTAHSIYQFLEYERLVEIRPKAGVFVSGGDLAQEQSHKAHFAVKVRRLVREARSMGFREEELRRLMEGCFSMGQSPSLVGIVECNEEMIELIGRDVMRGLRVNVTSIRLDELHDRLPEKLMNLSFLVTTEYHADEVRDATRRLEKEVYGVRIDYRIFEELEDRLRQGRVLFLAKDRRFVSELNSLLENVLSREEFDNFVGLPYEDRLLARYWMNRIRTVYVSPTCPSSFREWVLRNISEEVSLIELSNVVASESMKQLKDMMFFVGGPANHGPISRSALA